MFVEEHLSYLKSHAIIEQGAVGKNLRKWANNLRPDYKPRTPGEPSKPQLLTAEQSNKLPDRPVTRDELRQFCRDETPEIAFLAIAAWGGMNLRHGTVAWSGREAWKPALEALKTSNLPREQDFARLHALRIDGKLPGVGIPYFTKFLFFLRPTADSYIMDQWTAKSINILTGRNVVLVNKYDWVVDTNDQHRYKEFCEIVDGLAKELGCDGNRAETAIMSKGSPNPWPWRTYVKAKWAVAA